MPSHPKAERMTLVLCHEWAQRNVLTRRLDILEQTCLLFSKLFQLYKLINIYWSGDLNWTLPQEYPNHFHKPLCQSVTFPFYLWPISIYSFIHCRISLYVSSKRIVNNLVVRSFSLFGGMLAWNSTCTMWNCARTWVLNGFGMRMRTLPHQCPVKKACLLDICESETDKWDIKGNTIPQTPCLKHIGNFSS